MTRWLYIRWIDAISVYAGGAVCDGVRFNGLTRGRRDE